MQPPKIHAYASRLFSHQGKVALVLVICDIFSVVLAFFLALYIRFEGGIGQIPPEYYNTYRDTIFPFAIVSVAIYFAKRLYFRIWERIGHQELEDCIIAGAISVAIHALLMTNFVMRMPISYFVTGGFLQISLLGFTRFFKRILYHLKNERQLKHAKTRAMIIGAGDAGELLLKDLNSSHGNIKVCCFIDDDQKKWNSSLNGVKIIGGRASIPEAVRHYGISQIFIAMPSVDSQNRKEILDFCDKVNCKTQILPGLSQFANNEISLSQLLPIHAVDLLERTPVTCNQEEISRSLKDHVVFVTGAAGTIGSVLCHEIAKCVPKTLILMDINENSLRKLLASISHCHPHLNPIALIGSVQDATRVNDIFRTYQPDTVFHAAAYKQLALQESCPREVIKNNVFGTAILACSAMFHHCRRFFLLSTDKAVNPVSIMGASYRLAEILMQTLNQPFFKDFLKTNNETFPLPPGIHFSPDQFHQDTSFAAIRFGNVLDSEGSFLQRFQDQIANGGPVRIASPQTTRFCIPVDEVVPMLLQASTYANGGEVFTLDLGEPYNLTELAQKLIRRSGYIPGIDIKIEYTGPAPGEKLCESPLDWSEGITKTQHSKIGIVQRRELALPNFFNALRNLYQSIDKDDFDPFSCMKQLVASYTPARELEGAPIADLTPLTNASLEKIINQFQLKGSFIAAIPIHAGYINRTYRIITELPDQSRQTYVLQRINDNVFQKPQDLMENLVRATEHLKTNFRLPGRPDSLATFEVIPTISNQFFVENKNGFWRMLSFIPDIHSYDFPDNQVVFHNAGVAFGAFLKAISTLDPKYIHEVIPNFHNTPSRYQDLMEAVRKDIVNRVQLVQPELQTLQKHLDLFSTISDALAKGEIPTRLCHNDCNLNNVLFDNTTNQPVAVIDLDTIMPSTPLYDFGDSMRIGTSPAKDDEKDLSKVFCRLDFYEQYARGWLQQCGSMLTQKEKELLPFAAPVITSEDAIRFLTDYLNNDTYYYTCYQGQNLDRARTQIKLMEDMVQKLPQIREILQKLYREFNLL